jgi:hypothetical protein
MPLPALAIPAAIKSAEMFLNHRMQSQANRKNDRAQSMQRLLQGLGGQPQAGVGPQQPGIAQQMASDPLVQGQISALLQKLLGGGGGRRGVTQDASKILSKGL